MDIQRNKDTFLSKMNRVGGRERFYYSVLTVIFLLATAREVRAAYPTGANPWAYSTLTYRREVQLPPDPSQTRTNVPVWVDLKQLGTVDLASIKVDEITDTTPKPVAAAAYAQPSGRDPRAYWTAPGSTSAGKTRRFLIYYKKVSTAPAYSFSWRSGSFGSYKLNTESLYSWNRYGYVLTGDKVELCRKAKTVDKTGDSNHAIFYGNNSSFTYMKNLSSGFNPLSGLRLSYAFYGSPFSGNPAFFSDDDKERAFEAIKWDRNGPTIAMHARYSVSDLMAHKAELTHRLFQYQPLLEISLTATPNSGSWLTFSNDTFNTRQFHWNTSVFTASRMITDLGYDGSVNSDSYSKNFQILANSSGNAFGIFTFKPSTKRKFGSNALQECNDLASEQGSVYVYYAVGKVDEIKALFETMKRGYPLGIEETSPFTILKPVEGQRFITGESINVAVAGSNLGSDVTLKVTYPDGSSKTGFTRTSAGTMSYSFDLGAVATTAKFGTWTIETASKGTTRIRKIVVSNPDHPRLLFRASDLAALQARWKSDPRYASVVRQRLGYRASDALAKPLPPVTLDGSQSIRFYGRDIMYMASYWLMDQTQTQYRTRVLEWFRIMMAWPQWAAIANSHPYFAGEDLECGEVLHQLAAVYDWFYNYLSVAERRKYADLLARYADAILASDLANRYYPRWDTYNFINNNRSVVQSAALAAVDRAVELEVQDDRHKPWKDRLNTNYANLLSVLCTDGSNNAGQSYNGLLLWSLFVWSETRRLNTGDTSLYSTTWFREMPKYVLYGMMPGRVGNFGGLMPFGNTDTGPYYSLQTDLGIAGQRGDLTAQWISEELDYARVEPYQPIWQDYAKPQADPATQENWHYFNRRGIFVYRSDWGNAAMYFSTKCGEFWGGHEHPDAGTFVIHKNGYPYIAAPHYLNKLGTTDENILVAGGKIPRGRDEDNGMYTDPVAPQYWGKTLTALGSPNYFNVLQDPRAAYEDGSNLTSYNREFVGFPNLVLLRDTIKASASTEFRLLQHGYQTDPQTEPGTAYDPNQYPSVQVFEQAASNKHYLYPNKGKTPAERMTIFNLSRTGWTTVIEPWKLTPADQPGYISPDAERKKNSSNKLYSRGGQLRRTVTASAASALQLFSLRDVNYNARAWSTKTAEDGVVIYYGAAANKDDRFKVVWPLSAQMYQASNPGGEAEGLTAIATMVFRNYETREFGGRDVRYIKDESAKGEGANVVLFSSPKRVTFVSRTAGLRGEAWLACNEDTQISLYYPKAVTSATFNGKAVTVTGSGNIKTIPIPATPQGGKLVLVSPAKPSTATKDWEKYQ